MHRMTRAIRGAEVEVNVIERDDDLAEFVQFVRDNRTLAFDTETTGLDVYSNTFKLRMAQFGDSRTSYVIPVEKSVRWAYYASEALQQLDTVIIQNAAYDISVVERHWGINVDWSKVVDTKVLAHLVDSRPVRDGGPGHGLEELTKHYIDKDVAAEIKGSMAALAKASGTTKEHVWSKVDIDNPTYLLYAGFDPVLTFRLWEILKRRLSSRAAGLVRYEMDIQRICHNAARRGIRIDVKHTRRQVTRFKTAETRALKTCASLGVENPNSRENVVSGLRALGVTGFGSTDTGLESADTKLLKTVAKQKDDAGKLAKAIIDAKRASKWRVNYFEKFLSTMDSKGYIHPGIHTLAARTARMSITNPAVQTLPGDSGLIRNSMLADPGHKWTVIDYDGQELRMAAAAASDARMIRAFIEGDDLHQITADAAGVDRKVGKMANFLTVYGGGWKALVSQAGVDEATAKKVIEGIKTAYPDLARFSEATTSRAKRAGYVDTLTGRRLHVDSSRSYSAVNYLIQSASRDVTANALRKLDAAGFGPYILLPVHDEIDFSFPEDQAEEMSREAARLMGMSIGEVKFTTDIQIGGSSWGSIADFDGKDFHFNDEENDDVL